MVVTRARSRFAVVMVLVLLGLRGRLAVVVGGRVALRGMVVMLRGSLSHCRQQGNDGNEDELFHCCIRLFIVLKCSGLITFLFIGTQRIEKIYMFFEFLCQVMIYSCQG